LATILVVDDERPVLELLAMLLEDDGHRVVQAVDGKDALSLVDRQPLDLVISDVMMPVLDGVELCERLKADVATERIPVILMSSATRLANVKAPADAFVEKPFQLATIESLVSKFLDSGQRAA
jgi:CheY-like chemotaxis protein